MPREYGFLAAGSNDGAKGLRFGLARPRFGLKRGLGWRRLEGNGSDSNFLQKSRNLVRLAPCPIRPSPQAKIVGCRSRCSGAAARGREKFRFAKIRRNALKRLDSDERIQRNPSFSNPQNRVFAAQRPESQKTQTGPDRTESPGHRGGELNRLRPNAKRSLERK
jgi:hypothetical protein